MGWGMRRPVEIRRGRIAPRAPAIVELPLPGGDGGESTWWEAARCAILNSRVRPFAGPVEVSLYFREGKRARVIGGLPNACLQLLIAARLSAAVDSRVLKRLTLAWGGTEGVRVEIRSFEGVAK